MDLLGVLLPLCGLAVICGGLLLVGGFLVLRATGFNFGSIVDMITGGAGSDDDDDDPEFAPRKRTSLRDRAASLDFDSTVQKYSGTGAASNANRAQSLADRYKSANFGDTPSSDSTAASPLSGSAARDASGGFVQEDRQGSVSDDSLRRQLRRGRRSDDEAFGGMLDDEGDGIIDY